MIPELSGEDIRAAMRRNGIRTSDLAQRLELSQAAISNVLFGRIAPNGKLVYAIASELGLLPVQAPAELPRCPFMNSSPMRIAILYRLQAKRLAEALMIAVIANLITK